MRIDDPTLPRFGTDFIAPGVVLRIDDRTLPRDGFRPWFGVAGCLIPGVTQRSGDEVSTVTRSVGSTLSPQI